MGKRIWNDSTGRDRVLLLASPFGRRKDATAKVVGSPEDYANSLARMALRPRALEFAATRA